MKMKCLKCGYEGEMHQVGRMLETIKIAVIQCPTCCFLHDLCLSEPMENTKFLLNRKVKTCQ